MSILLTDIKSLLLTESEPLPFVAGEQMGRLSSIDNAWLYLSGDTIRDFGEMGDKRIRTIRDSDEDIVNIPCGGKLVFPAFCDSHTHLVYAGSREREYTDKIRGLSYEEIARRGGGILNSAALLRETSEDGLYDQSIRRIHEIM